MEKKYELPIGTLDSTSHQNIKFKDWKYLFEQFYQGAGEDEAMQRGSEKEG